MARGTGSHWSDQLRPIAASLATEGRALGLAGAELRRYLRERRPWWLGSEGGQWAIRAWRREVHLAVTGELRPIARGKRTAAAKPAECPDQGRLF